MKDYNFDTTLYEKFNGSLLSIDFMRIISGAAELEYCITRMEIMLNEAKVKQPTKDFVEQEKTIQLLKNNRDLVYELESNLSFTIKEAMKIVSQARRHQHEKHLLSLENQSLQKELETLKLNIKEL